MMKKVLLVLSIVTITSCQSEKDKLIDSKISSIDAQLELIELTEDEFDRDLELLDKDWSDLTDEEKMFMATFEAKVNRHTQLTKEREYWVLQK